MKYELRSLENQVVLITGASSGIGLATAKAFAQEGARLVLNGRGKTRLDAIVEEIGPSQAIGVEGDCSDPLVTKKMATTAIEKWGHLDVLVANAGTGFFGSVLSGSDEQIIQTVNTNFIGTIQLVRAGLPHLIAQEAGDIVIVASAAGYRGYANEAVYAGTKHAQVGFAGSLDREVRESGVRVSLICPAGTDTEFAFGNGRTSGDPSLKEYLAPEDVAFQILTVIKMPITMRTQSWGTWSMKQGS
jgi:NADP-dependent 3-hydroxy acid dehydrogenase YdfG